MSLTRLLNSCSRESAQTVFQLACGMQSDSGLSEPISADGLIRKLNSSAGSFLSFRRMLKQSCELKISLCRSKSPLFA